MNSQKFSFSIIWSCFTLRYILSNSSAFQLNAYLLTFSYTQGLFSPFQSYSWPHSVTALMILSSSILLRWPYHARLFVLLLPQSCSLLSLYTWLYYIRYSHCGVLAVLRQLPIFVDNIFLYRLFIIHVFAAYNIILSYGEE